MCFQKLPHNQDYSILKGAHPRLKLTNNRIAMPLIKVRKRVWFEVGLHKPRKFRSAYYVRYIPEKMGKLFIVFS